ncbi:60S ribosomal protein L14 [Datura stramonium]|uniref:60S ribosomal protein L14 n=1 Tax=Datura stramonium TaxID=4076 RepID=A0ABS8WTM4_DATST|nr:60S ribosomal protein L14 [Datura stramonium]
MVWCYCWPEPDAAAGRSLMLLRYFVGGEELPVVRWYFLMVRQRLQCTTSQSAVDWRFTNLIGDLPTVHDFASVVHRSDRRTNSQSSSLLPFCALKWRFALLDCPGSCCAPGGSKEGEEDEKISELTFRLHVGGGEEDLPHPLSRPQGSPIVPKRCPIVLLPQWCYEGNVKADAKYRLVNHETTIHLSKPTSKKGSIDSPNTVRRQLNFKRLSLADIKIDIKRIPKKKTLVEAMEAADVKTKWENSSWGRKLIVQKRRATLNDFDSYVGED